MEKIEKIKSITYFLLNLKETYLEGTTFYYNCDYDNYMDYFYDAGFNEILNLINDNQHEMDKFLDFIVLIIKKDLSMDAYSSRFFFLKEFFKRISIKSCLESNSLPKEFLFYFLDASEDLKNANENELNDIIKKIEQNGLKECDLIRKNLFDFLYKKYPHTILKEYEKGYKDLKDIKVKGELFYILTKEVISEYENKTFIIKKEKITSEYLRKTRLLIKVMKDLGIKYKVREAEKVEKENLMHLSVASISSTFFSLLFRILDGLENLSYIYYKCDRFIAQMRCKEEDDEVFQHVKKTIELWLSNTDAIQKIDDIDCLLKLKNIDYLTKDFVITELDLKLLKMNTLN